MTAPMRSQLARVRSSLRGGGGEVEEVEVVMEEVKVEKVEVEEAVT
jgi:hypothetical protein